MYDFTDVYCDKLLSGQNITLYNTPPYTIADKLKTKGYSFVSFQETRSGKDFPIIVVTVENNTTQIIAKCDTIFGIAELKLINKE